MLYLNVKELLKNKQKTKSVGLLKKSLFTESLNFKQ